MPQPTAAFGVGCPSWNLAFPDGNLTAAEILAYCPYWVKSIDVIDRLVTNGAGPKILATMLNEYRTFPSKDGDDGDVDVSTVRELVRNAMLSAGYKDWSATFHTETFTGEHMWSEGSLSVAKFRPPRLTHPRVYAYRNEKPASVQFRDLALHLKKHPNGNDALDLTRCVHYAVKHPREHWLFPDDFSLLVDELGGPKQVTEEHQDSRAFARRTASPRKPNTRRGLFVPTHRRTQHQGNLVVDPPPTTVMPRPRGRPRKNLVQEPRNGNPFDFPDSRPMRGSLAEENTLGGEGQKRRTSTRLAKKPVTIPLNDDTDYEDDLPEKRSLRLRNKPSMNFNEPDDDVTPMKESKSADRAWILGKDDDTSTLTSLPTTDISDLEDSLFGTPTPTRKPAPRAHVPKPARRAAKVALRKVKEINASATPTPPKPHRPAQALNIDPAIDHAALIFARHRPVTPRLDPLPLSRDRLTIDAWNVALFAEEGAADLWASALSSSRFGGPRRHPPWRELHRLTDPDVRDASDWAENIRWAKEQWRLYGSVWTEYEYSLEVIKECRRETMWVSEEVIGVGGFGG